MNKGIKITYRDDGKGKWQSHEVLAEFDFGTENLSVERYGQSRAEAYDNLQLALRHIGATVMAIANAQVLEPDQPYHLTNQIENPPAMP